MAHIGHHSVWERPPSLPVHATHYITAFLLSATSLKLYDISCAVNNQSGGLRLIVTVIVTKVINRY